MMIRSLIVEEEPRMLSELKGGQMFIDPEDGEYNIVSHEQPIGFKGHDIECFLFDPEAEYTSHHSVPNRLVHVVLLPNKPHEPTTH